jgi:hypothetical protein
MLQVPFREIPTKCQYHALIMTPGDEDAGQIGKETIRIAVVCSEHLFTRDTQKCIVAGQDESWNSGDKIPHEAAPWYRNPDTGQSNDVPPADEGTLF